MHIFCLSLFLFSFMFLSNLSISIFSKLQSEHTTELANYIWNLKDNNTDYKTKWEILNRTKSKFNTKFGCKLCNLEKIKIDKSYKNITLNKKSERQHI